MSPSNRVTGFWVVFAAAWTAYAGLFCSVSLLAEHQGLLRSLGLALASVGPAAALAVLIALRRANLLRPERALAWTVAIHFGVGIAYAVVAGVLVHVLLGAFGFDNPDPTGSGGTQDLLFRIMFHAYLYTILAGFLMWSESIQRVRESHARETQEAILRARAEASVLRAQFNPHFVFNTLHSLMLLVRADPAAAERAIEDVATLIRYASILQRTGTDIVPLSSELAVARRYISLEQLRLEDRLRVIWSVDVEPESTAIPSFALQTLLENAIRHGAEPNPEGGCVRIEIALEGAGPERALTIGVSDDGAGADPHEVRSAHGHGLNLLEQRLAMLYGERASLVWATRRGHGFSATIRIPESVPSASPELGILRETELAW